LAVFCGNCTLFSGKEKKLSLAFEPLLELQQSLYKCDSQFHTKILREQLVDSEIWGFIVIGGDGVSFHTLRGSTQTTLYNWNKVSLPKKHGRGGQSKQRFERIRDQKRGWYISEVANTALRYFIDKNTTLANINGLIIAGFADLKNQLVEKLDQRLAKIITCVVDVQYIGESGFRDAVELSSEKLSGLKYIKEQKIIGGLFEAIAKDDQYCLGLKDTIYALEAGAIQSLIVWDQLNSDRIVLKSQINSDTKVIYSLPNQSISENNWEIVASEPLLDWILDNYESFGAVIDFVSDHSSLGSQFAHGFGGIAGFLRYTIPLPSQSDHDLLQEEIDPYPPQDNLRVTDDNLRVTDNNLRVTDNNLRITEDNLCVTEDNLRVTEDNFCVTDENLCVTEDNLRVTEDNGTISFAETSREHLNIVFIGHVDAGKSTLSGRILLETNMVDQRTIEQYELEAQKNNRGSWFLAYIMDTHSEERKKGKTIEVGRANFVTKNKRYTILDTPGHKAYVSNMIIGTSQADIGILVISARNGEFEAGFSNDGQTREHCILAKSLGIKKLIVAINKMDDETVNWSEKRYNYIISHLKPFLRQIKFNVNKDVVWIPLSGYNGSNVGSKISCPWYTGQSLLETLDSLVPIERTKFGDLRIPILDKYKENGQTYILGKVESGSLNHGDTLIINPSKLICSVLQIFNDDGPLKTANVGENVKIVIKSGQYEDDIIYSGSVISHIEKAPTVTTQLTSMIQFNNISNIVANGFKCIMHIHTCIQEVTIFFIEELDNRGKTKQKHPKFVQNLGLVKAHVLTNKPIVVEEFDNLAQMGRFILRDDGKTVGFGKVIMGENHFV
jgi:peptide chain release factor subunit 3